jgi:hypothetical protein
MTQTTKITQNLKLFLAFCAAWAAIFFAVLVFGLHDHQATSNKYLSWFVVFVVVQSSVQRFLSGRDVQRSSRLNLVAWYASIAAASSLIVTCGWIMAWHSNIGLALIAGAASVAMVCLTAAGISKDRIKGARKEDLFQ